MIFFHCQAVLLASLISRSYETSGLFLVHSKPFGSKTLEFITFRHNPVPQKSIQRNASSKFKFRTLSLPLMPNTTVIAVYLPFPPPHHLPPPLTGLSQSTLSSPHVPAMRKGLCNRTLLVITRLSPCELMLVALVLLQGLPTCLWQGRFVLMNWSHASTHGLLVGMTVIVFENICFGGQISKMLPLH